MPVPSPPPRVSVIIVTWNARSLLERCLPTVAASTYPDLEIILADNASTDGSAEWVARSFPGIRIVRHPENWAFCRGNNEALPYATGKYVLLLNNDVLVPPGWLEPLVARMEAEPALGALQPKLLQVGPRARFEYAGAAGGFLDRHGYPFTRGRLFDTMEDDEGQYDAARYAFWASGAALLLRRSALETTGLLDERFYMHMEEIDLCWRLQRHGYRVGVEPRVAVRHIGGGSLPRGDARKVYLNFRNNLLLLYKNLPPDVWRRRFPERLLLDGLALLRAVATGRLGEAGAILRAYADAHRMKPAFATDRPRPTDRVVPLPYRGSIVVDYFLRGRRRFRDLPPECFEPTASEPV
ncbi:glycosyl hydrolase [Rhodothermaceae bacterium RA]|nr:glycosyl hydrolase [Rhodothermaceae bacterium RA]